jgi:N-acetyl-1-D-myo-inositol-2-amino-2-deoxy-alpha-D-glucopyranoside deacetylase
MILSICIFLTTGCQTLHPFVYKQVSDQVSDASVSFGERLLIIAPHPDDETLGGGGPILTQLRAKKQVKVIIMTTGDGYRKAVQEQFHVTNPSPADFRKLGLVRHGESIQALQTLSVKQSDVIFFGYPDGGVNGLWVTNWDSDHLHTGLNGSTHAPYSFAFEKEAPYCGANVVKNLMNVIQRYQPTDIVYPDPNDVHHDHWATHAFVKYTLTLMHYHTHEWTYLVHRYDWPVPWAYKPELPQTPPAPLRNVGTVWHNIPLTNSEETRKYQAVKQYPSQERVMRAFLEAFVRKNDLLGTYHPLAVSTQNRQPNFSKTGELPFAVVHDPVADTISRELHGSADIETVGITRTGTHIWVAIQTHQAIRDTFSYFLRFRMFHQNGTVTRDDIELRAGKPIHHTFANNSANVIGNASVHIQGNRLVLSFPINEQWQHLTDIMIGTDTYHNQKMIDKAAWQTVTWNT